MRIVARDVDRDIVSLERVSTVERVCHGQEGVADKFFYMYMCHFSQLHVRLPLDDFAMGVLPLLNVAPTQLHPNSWASLQAFRVLFNYLTFGVYNEQHMAQVGKKNLTFFQALRKEKAIKAKAAGNTEVPNLQESLVEVHVHGVTKRKVELTARLGRGKDIKKVRAALLGQGSSNGAKGLEASLIELPETNVRKDIEITMHKKLINSIDSMKLDHLVRTIVEFSSKALILGHRVGSLYRRELKEGNRDKLEELQGKVDKFVEEKATWEKEREEWKGEKKRLRTWKVGCLDSEEKFKGKIADLEVDYDELKEKHEGLEVELEDLKSCIIQEHINGFRKG
ncbi:hypothetical protein DEO72_LG4g51 [Vigna unguiculata]|uniref:Uncharacterized protein n=1 Tax=Vigna unguiculata TaxID=3917 RepID=A0A4D6LKR8_VIGUN|nr:hypothetical protein DEO72_LG4g51 [Vigna unguiculata]